MTADLPRRLAAGTFAGIAPAFIAAQLGGAATATGFFRRLEPVAPRGRAS